MPTISIAGKKQRFSRKIVRIPNLFNSRIIKILKSLRLSQPETIHVHFTTQRTAWLARPYTGSLTHEQSREVPERMDSSTRPITYELSFSKAEQSSELLRSAQVHRLEKKFIDVVLVLDDGVEIPAHRLVLASASAYFRTMFTINMHESSKKCIHLRDVDSASVEGLRRFRIYGKNFNHFR